MERSKYLTATMLSEFIKYQNDQKPAFKECNTPEFIVERIGDEHQELKEAIEKYPDDPFKVGSEMADIIYLSLLLCAELGFNVEDLVLWKSSRNNAKYPPEMMTDVNCFDKTAEKLKQEWAERGGDEAWENSRCRK